MNDGCASPGAHSGSDQSKRTPLAKASTSKGMPFPSTSVTTELVLPNAGGL